VLADTRAADTLHRCHSDQIIRQKSTSRSLMDTKWGEATFFGATHSGSYSLIASGFHCHQIPASLVKPQAWSSRQTLGVLSSWICCQLDWLLSSWHHICSLNALFSWSPAVLFCRAWLSAVRVESMYNSNNGFDARQTPVKLISRPKCSALFVVWWCIVLEFMTEGFRYVLCN